MKIKQCVYYFRFIPYCSSDSWTGTTVHTGMYYHFNYQICFSVESLELFTINDSRAVFCQLIVWCIVTNVFLINILTFSSYCFAFVSYHYYLLYMTGSRLAYKQWYSFCFCGHWVTARNVLSRSYWFPVLLTLYMMETVYIMKNKNWIFAIKNLY